MIKLFERSLQIAIKNGDNEIKGIIDWITAYKHLFARGLCSYIFMAPECKKGMLNIEKFEKY